MTPAQRRRRSRARRVVHATGRLTEQRVWQHVIAIKLAVAVGLLAASFLPPVHAAIVGALANQLWLWKT